MKKGVVVLSVFLLGLSLLAFPVTAQDGDDDDGGDDDEERKERYICSLLLLAAGFSVLGLYWYLEKHKVTLPFIHGLGRSDPKSNGQLRKLLSVDKPDRAALSELLTAAGSIDYALETARRYAQSAIARLETLPPSDAHDTLQRMAGLIVDRDQ